MATFLALLSVRHAVLSSNSSALEIALTASPMVFGTVPAAERVRREWAAAVEYLQDPSTVVDMATVAALAPGQRTVLCDLLGAHNSSDAQTAAARIVRMHGGVSAVNLLPTPPSPWRDLLAAAHNSQLPIADAPLEAKILARLAHTPFMAVPSGIALPQLKEIGYCAMWAHDYLIDQAAWDSLTGPLQGELRSHIGFAAALAPDSARDGCIAICNSWRGKTQPRLDLQRGRAGLLQRRDRTFTLSCLRPRLWQGGLSCRSAWRGRCQSGASRLGGSSLQPARLVGARSIGRTMLRIISCHRITSESLLVWAPACGNQCAQECTVRWWRQCPRDWSQCISGEDS